MPSSPLAQWPWWLANSGNLPTVQLTAPLCLPHSRYYSAHAAYCRSKLAQVLFSSHLHQELQSGGQPLSSCAVDPGMVNTALYRHLWTPLRLAESLIARLLFKVRFPPFQLLLFIYLFIFGKFMPWKKGFLFLFTVLLTQKHKGPNSDLCVKSWITRAQSCRCC